MLTSHKDDLQQYLTEDRSGRHVISYVVALAECVRTQQTEMEREFGEFRVYLVEVCKSCHWNHLVHSFTLGDGVNRKPPRKKPTVEDQDYR